MLPYKNAVKEITRVVKEGIQDEIEYRSSLVSLANDEITKINQI